MKMNYEKIRLYAAAAIYSLVVGASTCDIGYEIGRQEMAKECVQQIPIELFLDNTQDFQDSDPNLRGSFDDLLDKKNPQDESIDGTVMKWEI
jgi:hypothetical protein